MAQGLKLTFALPNHFLETPSGSGVKTDLCTDSEHLVVVFKLDGENSIQFSNLVHILPLSTNGQSNKVWGYIDLLLVDSGVQLPSLLLSVL